MERLNLSEQSVEVKPYPLEMNAVFSVERTVQGWLDAEVALARAQAYLGELTPEDAERIAQAAQLEGLDLKAVSTHGCGLQTLEQSNVL